MSSACLAVGDHAHVLGEEQVERVARRGNVSCINAMPDVIRSLCRPRDRRLEEGLRMAEGR